MVTRVPKSWQQSFSTRLAW